MAVRKLRIEVEVDDEALKVMESSYPEHDEGGQGTAWVEKCDRLQEYLFELVVDAAHRAEAPVEYPFYFTPGLRNTIVAVHVNLREQEIHIPCSAKVVASPVEATVWVEPLERTGGGILEVSPADLGVYKSYFGIPEGCVKTIEKAQAAFTKGRGRQTGGD